MSFWERLRYAIKYWPISNPWRWVFNRPIRDNPKLRDAFKKHLELFEALQRD